MDDEFKLQEARDGWMGGRKREGERMVEDETRRDESSCELGAVLVQPRGFGQATDDAGTSLSGGWYLAPYRL